MDPAPDPRTASAPFPTIPATSPRPRAARPRRHAAPFRSEHPAAASTRRSGSDLPRRPAASSFTQQEGAPLVGSWGASRDATFVFGSGVMGASEMKRSFSAGSGWTPVSGLSAAVGELVLDGSGRRSDADASGGDDPVSEMNSLGASGSNSSLQEGFCPDFFEDQAEQHDGGSATPSQAVDSPSCTGENVSIGFEKDGDSLPVGNSVDEGTLANDDSKMPAHGGHVQQNFFVFGGQAGYQEFGAHGTQNNINKVDSADKKGVQYSSGQDNNTHTKFILQDAKHAFGSSNKDPPHSEPPEVSATSKASDTIPYLIEDAAASELAECESFDDKSFPVHDQNEASRNKGGVKGMSMNRRIVRPRKSSAVRQVSSLEPVPRRDCCSSEVALEKELNLKEAGSFILEYSGTSCAKEQANSNNSASQTAESSLDGTEFTSAVNMEHSGQSDFIFGASPFDGSTLHTQRRYNKKKCGGMSNHASSIQSLPTSAIGLAQSEVSASQQCMDLAAQQSYSKVEHKMVPVGSRPTCAVPENIGYQEDCETWRLRLGNQAYAEGDLTKAEECYTHGITYFSTDKASRNALMLCYSNRAATRMSLGKMREALSDCREAIDIDSSFLKAQVRAANCLLALGDVEEAQKGFEICLKSNHASNLDHKIVEEASDGLHKAQSKEYLAKKIFDKMPSALQMISDALSISAYSDNLMAMKAEALFLLRQYEEVIRYCDETLCQAERNSVCFCPDEHSENNNLESSSCSVKLWRYHLIAKSYFFLGKLEEAHLFVKKYEQTRLVSCRCAKQSQQSISPFSRAISELLRLKAAGNEAFQAGKYSEAVEHYTAALLSNTESLRFSAICFCNRAAAYQAIGQILDAIADCSLAIALDADYSKAISRRSSLYELIGDYGQAANDIRRLISLFEKQLEENMSLLSEKTESIRSNLNRANLRFSSLERDARKGTSLNMYLISSKLWNLEPVDGHCLLDGVDVMFLFLGKYYVLERLPDYWTDAIALPFRGIEPSCSAVDIKKAYRKAALRHHPDKAGKFLVRSENVSDALWREITNEIRRDADYLFKLIGKAYAMLSDPTMKKQLMEPGKCTIHKQCAHVTGAARAMKNDDT
ncbi:hypothetical protein ACP70R_031427 [Stipagrostis hirtigluma subsp. patula]